MRKNLRYLKTEKSHHHALSTHELFPRLRPTFELMAAPQRHSLKSEYHEPYAKNAEITKQSRINKTIKLAVCNGDSENNKRGIGKKAVAYDKSDPCHKWVFGQR